MFPSIGQQLRQARQERNLSLEQVAYATHIRPHYLEALEAGEFEQLPSRAQARGFLRAYAGYLGLNAEQLLASLEIEPSTSSAAPSLPLAATPQAAEPSAGEARLLFVEIGQTLQRRRELLGLSLEDVERHTHLRLVFLRGLEAGNLDSLPSPVQGRGMLHNYAAFLGLDPEPLLLRFAEGLQARLIAKKAARPQLAPARKRPKPTAPPLRRLLSRDILLGGMLVVVLLGFIGWGALRVSAIRSAAKPSPTVPSIAEALQPTPEATPSPTPAVSPSPTLPEGAPQPTIEIAVTVTNTIGIEATPEAVTSTPEIALGAVQVQLVVQQRTWVRVTVDNKVAFEGRMLPGATYTFTGKETVEVLTGNGAGLQLFYNQRDLGLMGVYGEVVSRVFTPEGMVTPTPTITPTPTVTPPVSPTPEATKTLPTATPAP